MIDFVNFVNQIWSESKKSLQPVAIQWFMLIKKHNIKKLEAHRSPLFFFKPSRKFPVNLLSLGHTNITAVCPPDTASCRPLPPAHPIPRRAR
jgi:hypothetical protein